MELYHCFYSILTLLTIIKDFTTSTNTATTCRADEPVELHATAAPQYLQSPNYPFFYEPLTYCRWVVKAPESHVVNIEVLDTDTEGTPTCSKDFIEIRDGQYQWDYALRRWCGNKKPAEFTGYKNALFITFRTDNDEQGRGFRLKYWSSPKYLIEYKPVEFGNFNFFLMALSATLFVSILTTCTVIWINSSSKRSFNSLKFTNKVFSHPVDDVTKLIILSETNNDQISTA